MKENYVFISKGSFHNLILGKPRTVHYYLDHICLNKLIGHLISIKIKKDKPQCMYCKKTVSTLYRGYCFACSRSLAICDLCVLQPYRCHYHLGTCREANWGLKNCFIPHYVYLSYTSNFKVGITRNSHLYNRLIEQGAIIGHPIILTPSRRTAGIIEQQLGKHFSLHTNWRKMLVTHDVPSIEEFESIAEKLWDLTHQNQSLNVIKSQLNNIKITYPWSGTKINAKQLNIIDEPIEDVLLGCKGTYLIFESGVLNIRTLAGLTIDIGFNEY